MPIYEYQCRRCEHRLEKLQKISEPPLSLCPACGEDSLTKLVSAAGFRLKGGGWYETDFKKDGKRNLAGESGSPDKAANGTANGSADSKGGAADSGGKDKASESKPEKSANTKPAAASGTV